MTELTKTKQELIKKLYLENHYVDEIVDKLGLTEEEVVWHIQVPATLDDGRHMDKKLLIDYNVARRRVAKAAGWLLWR